MPLPKTLNGWAMVAVGLALAVLPVFIATTGDHPPLWAILVHSGVAYLGLVISPKGAEPKAPKP